VSEGKVVLTPRDMSKRARSLWGTTRRWWRPASAGSRLASRPISRSTASAIVPNLEGKNLNLQLGFSHDIKFPFPRGITIKVGEKQTRSRSRV